MNPDRVVLSLVERGWQAARECSLDAAAHGVQTTHLMKGRLPSDVRRLVQPHPAIRLLSVPKWLFWIAAWLMAAGLVIRGRLGAVVVDNERALQRVTRWSHRLAIVPILVREANPGYELWSGGQQVTIQVLSHAPRAHL